MRIEPAHHWAPHEAKVGFAGGRPASGERSSAGPPGVPAMSPSCSMPGQAKLASGRNRIRALLESRRRLDRRLRYGSGQPSSAASMLQENVGIGEKVRRQPHRVGDDVPRVLTQNLGDRSKSSQRCRVRTCSFAGGGQGSVGAAPFPLSDTRRSAPELDEKGPITRAPAFPSHDTTYGGLPCLSSSPNSTRAGSVASFTTHPATRSARSKTSTPMTTRASPSGSRSRQGSSART